MAKKKHDVDELQKLVNQLQQWIDANKGEVQTLDGDEDEDGDGIDRPKDPPKNP